MQRFQEETCGRLGIARRTQEKLECVPLRIHSPVEVKPDLLDFNIRLIHFPGVVAGFEMRSATLLQFGGILLNPAVDRGVIDVQTPLEHHLLQVTVAQSIAQVPPDAQENDVGLEVTPFERVLLGHGESSFALFS
jgi:hypothetical protein